MKQLCILHLEENLLKSTSSILYEARSDTLQYTTETTFTAYDIEHIHIPVLKSNHGKGTV